MKSRKGSVMKQYDFIKNLKLFTLAEDYVREMEETNDLMDERLERDGVSEAISFHFQIPREELDMCMDYAKFLMNCGLYQDALTMITLYM